MNESPPSLDQLHDIVLPPAAPWWPLAPGWYALIAILLAVAAVFAWRAWKSWQANAYRRAALRELSGAKDASVIAEILRRTALAIAPREEITGKSGDDWLQWLNSKCPGAIPLEASEQLNIGIYQNSEKPTNTTTLKAFAKHWITHHSIS